MAFFSDIESGNEFMPRKKPITLVSEVVSFQNCIKNLATV